MACDSALQAREELLGAPARSSLIRGVMARREVLAGINDWPICSHLVADRFGDLYKSFLLRPALASQAHIPRLDAFNVEFDHCVTIQINGAQKSARQITDQTAIATRGGGSLPIVSQPSRLCAGNRGEEDQRRER